MLVTISDTIINLDKVIDITFKVEPMKTKTGLTYGLLVTFSLEGSEKIYFRSFDRAAAGSLINYISNTLNVDKPIVREIERIGEKAESDNKVQ